MPTTPYSASLATTLAAVPVACLAASGTPAAGVTLLGAGLVGLAGLTLVSERWRVRAARRACAEAEAPGHETPLAERPAPPVGVAALLQAAD